MIYSEYLIALLIPSISPQLGTIFYGPGGVIHHIEEDCPEDCPSDSDDASAKLA